MQGVNGIAESNLSIFKRCHALKVSFVAARRVRCFQTSPGVRVMLNSNPRIERARAARANETRIVETKHYYDPIANDPFINSSDGNLS